MQVFGVDSAERPFSDALLGHDAFTPVSLTSFEQLSDEAAVRSALGTAMGAGPLDGLICVQGGNWPGVQNTEYVRSLHDAPPSSSRPAVVPCPNPRRRDAQSERGGGHEHRTTGPSTVTEPRTINSKRTHTSTEPWDRSTDRAPWPPPPPRYAAPGSTPLETFRQQYEFNLLSSVAVASQSSGVMNNITIFSTSSSLLSTHRRGAR